MKRILARVAVESWFNETDRSHRLVFDTAFHRAAARTLVPPAALLLRGLPGVASASGAGPRQKRRVEHLFKRLPRKRRAERTTKAPGNLQQDVRHGPCLVQWSHDGRRQTGHRERRPRF